MHDRAATTSDPEIDAERAYLDACRQALQQMREDVLGTRTALGDAVVDKFNNAMILRARRDRAEQLVDLEGVPLFFGRMAFSPGEVYDDRAQGERSMRSTEVTEADLVYVGRRNVRDASGHPMVVDWRAPIATAFYRASPADARGVRERRRYGFDRDGRLTAYEDERLGSTPDAPSGHRSGDLLSAEMERPRSGPMRDIVATIQPEQDILVRAPLDRTLCVQGAPGTGKTAVGLHRLAYLLYAERDRLHNNGGVAVIGPNRAFLAYIRHVLPALGEGDVRQTTIEDLIGHVPVRRADDPVAAQIKGDARMAEVIRGELWRHPQPIEETLVVERGGRRARIHSGELAGILTELRDRDIPYAAGPGLFARRIADLAMRKLESNGLSYDARTAGDLSRSRTITSAVRKMWPKVDPVRLVLGLLADREHLARAAGGLLTVEEQRAILQPGKPSGPKSAPWSTADLALIDEAAALIERPSTHGHLVVDEAQDLSPMQCRAIARRAAGSCTILGDLAQATSPGSVADWPTLLAHLGRPDGLIEELDRGYRVPAKVIAYAARLLRSIAPDLREPTSVRHSRGALEVTECTPGRLATSITSTCREALTGEGSVGVIAAADDIPALHRMLTDAGLRSGIVGGAQDDESSAAIDIERLVCVPASLAKGLEFETVIVAEPAHIVRSEPRGLHRLYVVLTRAVSALRILHTEPLPEALGSPAPERIDS